MGNRAVIATEKKDLGVYLHWNGGRDSVEAFLAYCKLRGFRAPEGDCYGWARLCQVVANYFGGNGLSIGIDRYEHLEGAGDDNGVYIIKGWEIVERIYPFCGFEEQREYELDEMLRSIDAAQPEGQRLGGFLDAEEVPASSLAVGDAVYMPTIGGTCRLFEVVGIGDGGVPYVNMYGRDGDYSQNPNNYIREATAHRPRR